MNQSYLSIRLSIKHDLTLDLTIQKYEDASWILWREVCSQLRFLPNIDDLEIYLSRFMKARELGFPIKNSLKRFGKEAHRRYLSHHDEDGDWPIKDGYVRIECFIWMLQEHCHTHLEAREILEGLAFEGLKSIIQATVPGSETLGTNETGSPSERIEHETVSNNTNTEHQDSREGRHGRYQEWVMDVIRQHEGLMMFQRREANYQDDLQSEAWDMATNLLEEMTKE